MDRIIKLMQVAGAVVLLVAVVAGYSFVRGLSAQEEPLDCESDPYCIEEHRGVRPDEDPNCPHPQCFSTRHICCLPEIIVNGG